MKTFLRSLSRWIPPFERHQWLVGLLVAVVYVWATLRYTDFRGIIEVNPDEGIELVTALLLDRGYSFGKEIWSSHPPLFHHILWVAFDLFGWELEIARIVMLYLSAILIFAVYDGVRFMAHTRVGALSAHGCAFASVVLLLLSHQFATLRVSVMIGQPAIAFAALALWAALRAGFPAPGAPPRRRLWLIVTGALFAASISIKAFTGFLWPTVALTALVPDLRISRVLRPRTLAPLLRSVGWLAAGLFPAILVFCSPLLASGALRQLYLIHVLANDEYVTKHTVWTLISEDTLLFCLAFSSAVACAWTRFGAAMPWVAWLASTMLILSIHDPVWDHYNQLLVVPGAALGGLGMACVASWLPLRGRLPWGLLLGPALAATFLHFEPGRTEALWVAGRRNEHHDRAALRALRKLDVPDGLIVTSNQMFAFLLKRAVPPQLAGTPMKRFGAYQLDAKTIIQQIQKYQPKLVILSKRWPDDIRSEVQSWLGASYERVYRNRAYRNFEVFQPKTR